MPRRDPTQPCVNTVGVENLDQTIESVLSNGGSIALPKMPVPHRLARLLQGHGRPYHRHHAERSQRKIAPFRRLLHLRRRQLSLSNSSVVTQFLGRNPILCHRAVSRALLRETRTIASRSNLRNSARL